MTNRPVLNGRQWFAMPPKNEHFGVGLTAAKREEELSAMRLLLKKDAHSGSPYTSYARNRLALVSDLCDILQPDGQFTEFSIQLLSFISPMRGHLCREACCRKDVLPAVFKHIRDKRPKGTVFSSDMEMFLKLCTHFDWFDWFAEQVREAVKNSSNDDSEEAAAQPSKKRRVKLTILGEQEVVSRWNEIAKVYTFPAIASRFEYGSVVRIDAALTEAPAAIVDGEYRIALASGRLPLSVEAKFAVSYARLCALGLPSMFRRIPRLYTVSGVPVVDRPEADFAEMPVFSRGRVFGSHQNFGFDAGASRLAPKIPDLFKRADNGPFLASLLLHVAFLSENLSWGDVVGRQTILNPLFFLAPENLVASETEFHVSPVLGIDLTMLPSLAFVEHHSNKVSALLCNNLARFLYFIFTKNTLPPRIGLEHDDEDGTSRTAFMFTINSFKFNGESLTPRQMHCLACLYFGDFDLRSGDHRNILLNEFGNSLFMHRYAVDSHLDANVERFTRKFLRNHVEDRPHLALSPDNANNFKDMAIRFCKQSSYPLIFMAIPFLTLRGSAAVGLGPHKELLRRLFLSACRHESFFLEINDSRRTICVRKNRQLSCRVCNEELDEGSPCIFVHDEYQAASRIIASECMFLRIDLPVTFSFGAIVETLTIQLDNADVKNQLEYADAGPIAQKVSALSINENSQIAGRAPPTVDLTSEETQTSLVLRTHFNTLDTTALYTMYCAINKLPPFQRKRLVEDIDVETVREVVFRLCKFSKSKLNADYANILQQLRDSAKNDTSAFAQVVRNLEASDKEGSKLQILRALVSERCENRTRWSFLVWLFAASRENLCAFVAAMGSDPSLIAVYAEEKGMTMTHHKYRLNAEYQKVLEESVCKPETLLSCPEMAFAVDNDSGEILSSDRIAVVVSPGETRHTARIATCFRTLTLMTDLRPSQLGPSMHFLIDAPGEYNSL